MITILYSALLVILAYKISRMIRKHFLIVLLLSTILSTLSYYFKIDFILTGYLGLSFLIIVMFAGALKKGSNLSKKLKSVRKEYSILGFVFITSHSIYYFVQFWSGLMKYELIGVIAYIIMIPLFITSFSKIRKRVTYKSWQKLHKFSYIAYLLIFIHLLIVGNFENRILYILVFSIYTMVKIVNYLILKGSFYKNMIQAIIIVIVLNLAILNLFQST